MDTKNLLVLITHFDSINIRFVSDFVCGNMLWAVGSLWVFVCNYVLYSFGLLLKYICRFQVGERKNELPVQPTQGNQIEDSELHGFGKELVNFLFQSTEYVHEDSEERERQTESSVFLVSANDAPEESKKREGRTESSVSKEIESDIHEDTKKSEGYMGVSVLMATDSNFHEDSKDSEGETTVSMETEGETELSDFMETNSDFQEDCKREGKKTECSVFMEGGSIVHKDGERKKEEGTEKSVFQEGGSNILEASKRTNILEDSKRREEEEETEISDFMEGESNNIHENCKHREGETENSVSMENGSHIHSSNDREGEKESSITMKTGSDFHGDCKKSEEETETSVFMEGGSNVHEDNKRRTEEETESSVFMGTDTAKTTSKFQYVSGKDLSGFMEEPTTMTFSFREYYVGPYVSDTEISDLKSEKDSVLQEEDEEDSSVQDQGFPKFYVDRPYVSETEISDLKSGENPALQEEAEESVQEQRTFYGHSISDQFSLKSEFFGESDSYDEDDLDFNENSFGSDSESESSSSSGLIWGNSNKSDDSITYQFLAFNNDFEGFESESLKLMKNLRAEEFRVQSNFAEDEYIELEPHQKNLNSWDTHYFSGKAKNEDEKKGSDNEEENSEKSAETRWEKKLAELDSDDNEWEEDELVEQMKMELRNARQGGLATILEEEEEEEEERESPKVVEDLKPLKIEEKHEFKDQIGEIQKVHRSYDEKMRKLDILNYQTMHALGLLQLKDSPKLISKPLISQNLWPRKAPKNSSDPLRKFVRELHRDLEVVYVGQVCISWEILCWQHRKAQELKQYDSQWARQYNLVAGEFQLFQVLLQRFIENEPFQGPRIQNYVKNRCVIRNLLQVPPIKDDSMKDKNNVKREEENAVASGRLAEIIKESMRVFWEFVRADKDDGNVLFKVSQQNRTHLKDPAISDLLIEIRTHLQKKEKKLKDIVRTGNCIVRKFQKQQADKVEVDHEQLVAQVELKLISRVLNMRKLRKDQLIWCNEKLKRITFVSRKIQVEPSFLLFPF